MWLKERRRRARVACGTDMCGDSERGRHGGGQNEGGCDARRKARLLYIWKRGLCTGKVRLRLVASVRHSSSP